MSFAVEGHGGEALHNNNNNYNNMYSNTTYPCPFHIKSNSVGETYLMYFYMYKTAPTGFILNIQDIGLISWHFERDYNMMYSQVSS